MSDIGQQKRTTTPYGDKSKPDNISSSPSRANAVPAAAAASGATGRTRSRSSSARKKNKKKGSQMNPQQEAGEPTQQQQQQLGTEAASPGGTRGLGGWATLKRQTFGPGVQHLRNYVQGRKCDVVFHRVKGLTYVTSTSPPSSPQRRPTK